MSEHEAMGKIHPHRRRKDKARVDAAPEQSTPEHNNEKPTSPPPIKYTASHKINWAGFIIPVSALIAAVLAMFAAPHLIDTSGLLGVFKMVMLGVATGFISWVVNYHAVTYGTDLTANGLKSAGVVSLLAVTITGGAAFGFSYAGIVLPRVDGLNQADHGRALGAYVEQVNQNAAQLTQLRAVIATTASDLQAKSACESSEGCLSGVGGGKGALYRALLSPTQRAEQIDAQLQVSDEERRAQLADINKTLDAYYASSGDDALSPADKTRALTALSGEIKQRVADLRESAPLLLLRGYQAELDAGLSLARGTKGADKADDILKRHGDTLAKALDEITLDQSAAPVFPNKAGVGEAFAYFWHFWPIGIFTAAIELIIPWTLWLLTYAAIVLRLYREEHADDHVHGHTNSHAPHNTSHKTPAGE